MSPALVDTRAPAHNLFHHSPGSNKGQISNPLTISSLETSGFNSDCQLASSLNMNPYGGLGTSTEVNPNFEFSSLRQDPQKPIFSSSSGLSRPRTVKHRKSDKSRQMGSSETQKMDPAFHLFRPVSGNLSGVSSRMDSDGKVGLGSQRSVLHDDHAFISGSNPLNLKVEKVGNVLVDEISKLRIESQADSHTDRIAKNFGENHMSSELASDIKKLHLGAGGESSKKSGLARDTFGRNREGNLGISHGQNVGTLFGTPFASELPNDLKRLNLKDTGEVDGHNFVFGANSRRDFVFGRNRQSNDPGASGVASTLSDKIKNLNIEDSDKTDGSQEERNSNQTELRFDHGSSRTDTSSGGEIDPMILDEIETMKIGDHSKGLSDNPNLHNPPTVGKEVHGNISGEGTRKSDKIEFMSQVREQGEHSSAPELPQDKSNTGFELHHPPASSTSSVPPTSSHFLPVRGEFQMAYMDGAHKKYGFSFHSKHDGLNTPYFEFRTQDPKGGMFRGSNQKMEFDAKKGPVKDSLSRGRKGRKAKPKEPNSVLMSFERNSESKENNLQHDPKPSEPSSPMDFSPYRETQDDKDSAREPFMTPVNQPSNVSHTAFSNYAIDEDLVAATESMDINKENDVKNSEVDVQVLGCSDHVHVAVENPPEVSFSAIETESFKTAAENFNGNGEIEVESNDEVQSSDQTQYFSPASSASSGGSTFTFASSPSFRGQSSAAMRHHKKKNRMKSGIDVHIPSRTTVISDAASSSQFSPISEESRVLSPVGQKSSASAVPQKGGISLTIMSSASRTIESSNLEDTKEDIASLTAAARAAQEACEKWRLRGNQAYSNGDLETAEDYYTRGLSCIPQNEKSRDCVRALVLCYSNRAATRMSLGRMREALGDCLLAAEIDPNFFRVQLRAANCYLALGEVFNASQYFKKLLQSTDACVERKLILDASDGLQQAQKLSECTNLSAKLLQQRTFTDVERALGVIAEALVISPYSEQLLAHKAEALFRLRRYEELILLCEHTLEAAEKNSPLLAANRQSPNMEDSDVLKNYSFRIWRYSLIFKSNFYLGKLEEALNFLEKQEKWRSMVDKYGDETLESLIPQLSTARELIRHKSAGNLAFKAGRHGEAVEHYTAALSFKVESRPFAAVCFGNRAAAYQALGQITDAVADCSLAIALDGNYLKAISRRAMLFEMTRDYEQAAKDLKILVSLLSKEAEGKANQMAPSLPTNSVAELRQARQRLFQMEEQAKKGIPLNFYLILGVEPSVSAADLKKAYRKAALKHHPDKAGQSLARSEGGDDGLWKEIAEEVYKDADRLFKMIGEAFGVLSDPTKSVATCFQRLQYDIEEETRNCQKRSTSRMHTDTPFNTDESSVGSGRHWREGWRSSANPYPRGFEPTRSSRDY
ncbi:hypothetical protein Cgig2_002231 [Carnegiea gigantea]|uniref:J domain-containing protein n=1 Tax=Carnegiea gigantea TaxID=171969 RepID=A0A9Q1KTJ8_9CARY|nr:hypothetical protein Cgig2_002231 [Carnegiea gigantea]